METESGAAPGATRMAMMTCRELADFVMAYVDDALAAEERHRFDEHLRVCPDCVRYLQQYRDTIAATRLAAADDDVPADVPDDLVKAILDARRPR